MTKRGEKSGGYWLKGKMVDGSTEISVKLSIQDWLRIMNIVIVAEMHKPRVRLAPSLRKELVDARKRLVEAIWKARGRTAPCPKK